MLMACEIFRKRPPTPQNRVMAASAAVGARALRTLSCATILPSMNVRNRPATGAPGRAGSVRRRLGLRLGRLERLGLGLGLGLVLAACAKSAAVPPRADVDSGPLAASLQIGVADDSVRFNLYVRNTSATALVLSFATAQRYDFAVETADGDEVWRWSGDRMFAQVTGEETLAPGETLQYGASWLPQGRAGTFVAVAVLRSEPGIERRMQFQIP